MKFFVDIHEEEGVVGWDPERADLTNPRGTIWKTRYYLTVSNRYGRRWARICSFPDREYAEERRELLQVILDGGGKLKPDAWQEMSPVYGSPCYEAEWMDWEPMDDESWL